MFFVEHRFFFLEQAAAGNVYKGVKRSAKARG
jgi:hypothetical protein